jgi:hypothetical protein
VPARVDRHSRTTLTSFLAECRDSGSAAQCRGGRPLRLSTYQYLSEAEHEAFQAGYETGDEQAFCHLFGAEKIVESVVEFLGYFMIRKVAASSELLRASGAVVGKLVAWFAEHGELRRRRLLRPNTRLEVPRRILLELRPLRTFCSMRSSRHPESTSTGCTTRTTSKMS